MKKKILLTLIIAIFTFNILGVNIIAIATDEETNTWDVSENGDGSVIATLDENGTLTIKGNGKMKNYEWKATPWYKYIKNIEIVNIENGVTSIGNDAFCQCERLTDIKIPSSVTRIGINAFYNCESLTNVTIPEGVTIIGDNAFSDCYSLKEINIPSSVIEMRIMPFNDCYSLTNIIVGKENKSFTDIGGVLFNKDKTEIQCYPAGKKERIYEIPESVTTIKYNSFSNCTSLTEVKIPSNVTSIEWFSFTYCTNLEKINIPESVTEIGMCAFCHCESLTKINIPSSVVSIGDSVFWFCTNLKDINVAYNNERYMSINGVLFNKEKTEIKCYPAGKKEKNYTIPDSVTDIGINAFTGCYNLTEIKIPSSVVNIRNDAFYGCENLRSIKIPESVTKIETGAFSFCVSLTNIIIPESLKDIDDYTFSSAAITVPIGKNNEVKLPEIIKRAINEEDILYAEEDVEFSNCTLSEDKTKLIVTSDEEVRMKIKSGKLKGLTVEATKVTKGDINLDGKIDFQDILEINKYRLQKVIFEVKQILASDVNNDFNVDILDIFMMNKYRLGKIDSLE